LRIKTNDHPLALQDREIKVPRLSKQFKILRFFEKFLQKTSLSTLNFIVTLSLSKGDSSPSFESPFDRLRVTMSIFIYS